MSTALTAAYCIGRSLFERNQERLMRILHVLGVLFIVAWLVLWLALKLTFAAIHALVVIGVLLIVIGLFTGRSATSNS